MNLSLGTRGGDTSISSTDRTFSGPQAIAALHLMIDAIILIVIFW